MLEPMSIKWVAISLIEYIQSPLQKQVYFLLKTSIFTSIRGVIPLVLFLSRRKETMNNGNGDDRGNGHDFVDNNGVRRIGICPDLDGDAFMGFADKNGKARMAFVAQGDGKPAISMRDKNGVTRLSIGLTPDGEPGIVFYNEKGEPCFVLGPDIFS